MKTEIVEILERPLVCFGGARTLKRSTFFFCHEGFRTRMPIETLYLWAADLPDTGDKVRLIHGSIENPLFCWPVYAGVRIYS